MKRASVIFFCLAVCLLASASIVQAGGFALYEWSNRGLAMGTTGYAQGVDASVIATNPALMTKLEGQKVLVGATAISPQTSVVLDGHKTKTKAKIYMVPHAYYTKQMESNENVWLGVGMFTRFGLGTHYDDNWQGRGSLQYVDVASVSMNPNIAFKFNDHFSLAVGAEVLKGSFDLQRAIPFLGADNLISFHTKGYGFGANLGLHYQFDDQWAAGFTYRSPMHLSTTGSGQNNFPGRQVSSNNGQHITATLPSSCTAAVSFKPTEKWVLEFDTPVHPLGGDGQDRVFRNHRFRDPPALQEYVAFPVGCRVLDAGKPGPAVRVCLRPDPDPRRGCVLHAARQRPAAVLHWPGLQDRQLHGRLVLHVREDQGTPRPGH